MAYNIYPKSKEARDKKYIESGVWKCSKSPTGAHHWVIIGRQAKCKYCLKEEQLDDKGLFNRL